MTTLDAKLFDAGATAADPSGAAAHAEAAEIWALLGNRLGDNRMIETMAAASGARWKALPLRFNPLGALPNVLARGSLYTLSAGMRALITPPWPRVVITSGKRAVPVALRIKAASGGAVRLVHLGRPQAPLGWFDLVITSTQYGLPERPNVATYRFPPTAAVRSGCVAADLAALPRPRLAVVVGGATEPLALDAGVGRAIALASIERARASGGSLLVVTSPRTATAAVEGLRDALSRAADVTIRLSVFGEGENRYRDFLAAADAFLVTDDTASMAVEAAMTGAPVTLFHLPDRPKPLYRTKRAAHALMLRSDPTVRLLDKLVGLGLVRSNRDLAGFMQGLESDGFLAGGDAARAQAEFELSHAASFISAMISRNR